MCVIYMKENNILVEVRNLKKYFVKNQGIISSLFDKKTEFVKAVNGVSFNVKAGEILGVAGESGCGKTTLGRTLIKLLEPSSGRIIYNGTDIAPLTRKEMRKFRTEMQIVFQDPYESLDPRAAVYDSVAEPLEVNNLINSKQERRARVMDVLKKVKLEPVEDYIYKFPHSLSGGERQRVAIATALILNPKFIVIDEPTSMLDVSTQANILNLLKELNERDEITFLFITHNLSVAYIFSNRLAIMYLGKIVEIGPTKDVLSSPVHPYTKALISAVPTTYLEKRREPIILSGETPDPANVPLGCSFHPRCPERMAICEKEEPSMRKISGTHYVACFKQD